MAYTPTLWADGDKITAERLNKLEQGVANEQVGPPGTDGATFTPAVSSDGVLSFTNDKGLPNPAPVNIKGAPGTPGTPGENGRDGQDGADGKSAYQIAVDNGYTGTETEWLASLKGADGATGPQGTPGVDGATGPAGKDGSDGFSPTVAVIDIIGGHRVTITDATGPHTFDVMDGQDGSGGGSAGVSSFNGRSGAVVPGNNDYTAAMVGARPNTWVPDADEVSLTPPAGMTATNVQEALAEVFTSGSEGKALVASAITAKGVATAADATFQIMHDNILEIPTGSLPEGLRTITVTADPPEGGSVSGGGVAQDGMIVTVNASIPAGYDFLGWKENENIVSNNQEYFFVVQNDRNLIAKSILQGGLPSGYVQLQYISNPNKTYIADICDVNPIFSGTRAEISIGLPNESTYGQYRFMGSRSYKTGAYRCGCISFGHFSSYDQFSIEYGAGNTSSYIKMATIKSSDIPNASTILKIIVDLPKNLFSINSFDTAANDVRDSNAYTIPTPSLFACHADLSSGVKFESSLDFKFYGLRIFSSTSSEIGEVLYDYVPCTNQQGTVGIYDRVSKAFKTSASQSSPLVAGPAV